jgi:hypothetical protein
MESKTSDILDTNNQEDHKVDEGDPKMEITPKDAEAAKADDVNLSLQERTDNAKDPPETEAAPESDDEESKRVEIKRTPQEVSEIALKALENMEYLDNDLDTMMMDQTMSIVKAKQAGDMVAIIECPYDGHKVDLTTGRGFFQIDLADVARKNHGGYEHLR